MSDPLFYEQYINSPLFMGKVPALRMLYKEALNKSLTRMKFVEQFCLIEFPQKRISQGRITKAFKEAKELEKLFGDIFV